MNLRVFYLTRRGLSDGYVQNIGTEPEFCIHDNPEGHEFSTLVHNNSFRPLVGI